MRVIIDGRNESVAVPTWILGFDESLEFLTMIPKEEQRMSWSSETKQRVSVAFSYALNNIVKSTLEKIFSPNLANKK